MIEYKTEGINKIFKIACVRHGRNFELRQKQGTFEDFSFDISKLKCQ